MAKGVMVGVRVGFMSAMSGAQLLSIRIASLGIQWYIEDCFS